MLTQLNDVVNATLSMLYLIIIGNINVNNHSHEQICFKCKGHSLEDMHIVE